MQLLTLTSRARRAPSSRDGRSMRTGLIVVAVAAVAALAAPLAGQAQPTSRGVVVATIDEVADGEPMEGCLFVLAFPLRSPSGAPLGDGTACATGGDFACFPAFAGCRQTVLVTFRFNLAGGFVESAMTLTELYTGPS